MGVVSNHSAERCSGKSPLDDKTLRVLALRIFIGEDRPLMAAIEKAF